MNNAILSEKYPQFTRKLSQLGYRVIPSGCVDAFIPYEQDHADMQCLLIEDTAFVLRCCSHLTAALQEDHHVIQCGDAISGAYPHNVILNVAVLGKRVLCRVESLDIAVKDYCESHGYQLINVNQGYAGCSCAVVSENAVITADNGIYHSIKELKTNSIDVLKVGQGSITLKGANYGFIGGASGYDKDTQTIYFCGNIHRHPDGEAIIRFCEKHGTQVICLSDDDLIDIGGILFC